MSERIPILNTGYKVQQTFNNNYQGICIIAKREFEMKIESDDCQSSWILVVSIRSNGKICAYIIGVYRKAELKRDISKEVTRIIKRIKKKQRNVNILVFGDMNVNHRDNIEKLQKDWGLEINYENNKIVTRKQILKNRAVESTLDYFLSTSPIKYVRRIDNNGGSDHYPLEATIDIPNLQRTNKSYTIIKWNRNPTTKEIKELFKSDWPLTASNNVKCLQKKTILRPRVFLSKEKSKIFSTYNWESIIEKIKLQSRIEYEEFIKEINNYQKTDLIKFYKVMKSILKYKENGRIVNRIKMNGEIQWIDISQQLCMKYYSELLNWDTIINESFVTNETYTLNTLAGLTNIASRKAVGIDNVPGEWIKINPFINVETNMIKLEKLQKVFKYWIETGYVPDFWMISKIILLSKENSDTPEVNNTRPIAILPSITKVFELSILENLEKIGYQQRFISSNQRGFTPNKSTTENIYDLFQFWMNIKNSNNKKFGALIFIDLKRAYDWVNRNLLLKLLKEAKVPGKIIEIIKIMFSKSWISFGNKLMWRTTRGLLQGSCLSPILFNFYINPMLRK